MNSITEFFKVDSCRLSIPVRQCTIINSELNDYFTDIRVNKSTGEQTELKTYNCLPYQQNYQDGTSIKIWINQQLSYDKQNDSRYTENYITLLLNSKHLRADYFKGITKDTYKQLYDYVMSLDVFECTYKAFQNSRYTDIDICSDFNMSEQDFSILKKILLKSANDTKDFHTSNKSNNSGIWTPTRKDPRKQATPARPFTKFYSKQIDFTCNSQKFAGAYFTAADYQDLVRFECTIKNSEHKRHLGINSISTFWEFLNADLQNICKRIFNEYFEKVRFVRKKTMTPLDLLTIDLINLAATKGASKTEIQKLFNRTDVTSKARIRLSEKYQQYYYQDRIDKNRLIANEKSKTVLEFLGLEIDENEQV